VPDGFVLLRKEGLFWKESGINSSDQEEVRERATDSPSHIQNKCEKLGVVQNGEVFWVKVTSSC